MENKVLDGIMGLCVADAMGVPVEFSNRQVLKNDPVTGMRSYGTYNQPIGTWSDDTSMTLCLADSLTAGLNYNWIMQNFIRWIDIGAYTTHGKVFDVGMATLRALERYKRGMDPLACGGTGDSDNGNGSLMRILPILFYIVPTYGTKFTDNDEAMNVIHNVSSLTHAHKRSLIACGIYTSIASELISGLMFDNNLSSKVRSGVYNAMNYYRKRDEFADELRYYERPSSEGFGQLPEQQIKSSGYVIDTLEAAIWCLLNTKSYKECVLKAVNLGGDTDTVAAVAGGLAGLYYGYKNIPQEWLTVIVKREYIEDLCNKLHICYSRNSIEKICKYIPFIEMVKLHREYIREKPEESKFESPCPVCEDIAQTFFRDFYESNLLRYEYSEIITKWGFRYGSDMTEQDIDTANFELASAILTFCIRAHHWASSPDESLLDYLGGNKIILRILKRLQQIAKEIN